MAHAVDFQGSCQDSELKQIRSETQVTFKIDHFMDRVEEANSIDDDFLAHSPDISLTFKDAEGNKNNIFYCYITIQEIKQPQGGNYLSIYVQRSDKNTIDRCSVKLNLKIRGSDESVINRVFQFTKNKSNSGDHMCKKTQVANFLTSTGSLILDGVFTVIVDTQIQGSVTPEPLATETSRTLSQDLQASDFPADFSMLSADGYNIPCFKNILAARSPVFKTMLTSGNFTEVTVSRIKIKEFKNRTLKTFWRFLISDVIDINEALALNMKAAKDEDHVDEAGDVMVHSEEETVDIVRNLLLLSEKYNIPSLKVKAEAFLVEKMTSETALATLEVASTVGAKKLVDFIVEYIVRNRVDENFAVENIVTYDLPKDIFALIMKAFW